MKRSFLDFTKIHIYRPTQSGMLPALRTRHNRGACFKSASKPDDAGDDDDDDDTIIDPKDESGILLKKINQRVKKALAGRATVEQIREIQQSLTFLTKGKNEKGEDIDEPFPIEALREMAKGNIMQKLIDQGLEIQKLKAEGERQIKDMSIRGQVTAWIESKPKELGGTRSVKDVLESIKNGTKENIPPMELQLRVASPMHVSTVNSGASTYIGRVEVESGINDFLRFPNTFWDFLKKGSTSSPTYVWVNKTNPLGAAAFIGPGVAKPGISFELAAEQSVAKKIADSAKAGTELLQDIDGMVSFIEDELRAQVEIKINETLMATSAGSSTVPAGIRYYAQDVDGTAFTASFDALKTVNPNYMDAIRSAVAALRAGKLSGEITVFINSVDAANMDMAKANDSGVYILPPFVTANGRTIGGATIIEDQNIATGFFLAGFLRYYRILIYKGFTIYWGWENDDFTKNLVTVIGEMRLHQFVNSIHTGFVFYDKFTDVIDRITQA